MAPHALVHPSIVRSTTDISSLPNIVSNFQDLSAVLTIFAADTIERKLTDPRANDLERMSTTWSIFGMVGIVRAYIKLAAGIHSAERAGLDIYDFGGYTSEQTKYSLSACTIGSSTHPSRTSWQDDQKQLLGQVDAGVSRWKRPNIIVMGYSQCPFEGERALREILGRSVLGFLTVIITCLPLLVLRQSAFGDLFDNIAIGTAAGGAFLAGCLLPLLIQNLNPVGVMQLRDLPGRSLNSVLQAGDVVITSKTSTTIFWQKSDAVVRPRSGDRVSLRLLATLSACVTVVAYIFNYLQLGRVQTWRAYSWLGSQAAILALRFVLWATRPRVVANRSKSVLFFISGSLVSPLAVEGKNDGIRLDQDIVRFAVASASSKVLNAGGNTSNLKLQALNKLSNIAPADILMSEYCDLAELMKRGGDLEAIRLPWSWMEEIYAAQGLILGHNPWALGGLYLAAIVEGKIFHGLTTIHPRGAGAGQTHGEDTFTHHLEKEPPLKGTVGITADNFGINDLVCGLVMGKIPSKHDLMDWHGEFRENVRNCRLSAVLNGPPHCELHVRNFGEGPFGGKRVSKTVPNITRVLEQGLNTGIKERQKDHSKCKEFCTIFGF